MLTSLNKCLKLPNLENTCYVNASLQLLLSLPSITDAVIQHLAQNTDPFILAFLRLFEETKKDIKGHKEEMENKVMPLVEIAWANFPVRTQQDCFQALEVLFLPPLLNAFANKRMLENVGLGGTMYVSRTATCCDTSSTEVESFNILTVPIPDDVLTIHPIQQCLVACMSYESSDSDFKCPECSRTCSLTFCRKFCVPPKVLIFRLMREIFDRESGTYRKNKCQVSVTTSLDMSMHLQAIAAEVPCLKYGLRCVVFHLGDDTLKSGHYFVAVKVVQNAVDLWYVLDDYSDKKLVDINTYLSSMRKQVYILVYEREDSTEQECDRGSGKEDVMSTAAARAAAPAAGAPAKKAAQILVCNPIPIPIRSSNPHP